MTLVFRDLSKIEQAQIDATQLSAIVKSSSDAIIGTTMGGQITSWNRAAVRLFGYSEIDALGQSVRMLMFDDDLTVEDRLEERLTSGESIPSFEALQRQRDGTSVEVAVTISAVKDAEGSVIGTSRIIRNIADQKRADELRLSAAHLVAENKHFQEASRLKNEFLSNMSHELRTPLNAIIGFAELLHSGNVPEEKHKEFLGYIGSSGSHLLALINDVLDLSKVESGMFDFYPENVNLALLIDETVSPLRSLGVKRGIDILVHVAPDLSAVKVDPVRLKQVLYNYLSNALKFTEPGTQVQLRVLAQGPYMFRIEVEDSGIGISEPDIQKLFVEFQQLDTGVAKRHQGTGLGLALTRKLVEAQGGSVGVQSRLHSGSTFYAVLPRVVEIVTAKRLTSSGTSDRPLLDRNQRQRPTIMLVTDERALRESIASILDFCGIGVEVMSSDEESARRLKGDHPDSISINAVLDEEDFRSLEKVCRNPLTQQTSFTVHVRHSTPVPSGFAVAAVLSKPLDADLLSAAMARTVVVGRRKRVLIIDDEDASVELMGEHLRVLQAEWLGCSDGFEALSKLDDFRPDVIILDLLMPKFDGFQVLNALRANRVWAQVPVFVWTSMSLTREEYERLGRAAVATLKRSVFSFSWRSASAAVGNL